MASILSDIVGKHSRHIEDICSESLALILNQSSVLKGAFSDLVKTKSNGTVSFTDHYLVKTQVTTNKDSARPDLEGDDNTSSVFLVEAKFWAGLTQHQPLSYLKRIYKNGGALIFLAPERRLNSLNNEIEARLQDGGITYTSTNGVLNIQDNTVLFYLSWTEVISAMWSAAVNASEQETLHNLFQLKTLVEKLDSEGFIPLEHSLFTPAAGIQRDQMIQLLDMVVENHSDINTKGLTYGGGKFSYQRFFRVNSRYGAMLYSSEKWMKYQKTPIYLGIYHEELKDYPNGPSLSEIEKSLVNGGVRYYPKEDLGGSSDVFLIPLYPKLGVDKQVAYEDLYGQVNHCLELIFKV